MKTEEISTLVTGAKVNYDIGTPCLICGESVPIFHIHDTPKICQKCKDAVMKVRGELSEKR